MLILNHSKMEGKSSKCGKSSRPNTCATATPQSTPIQIEGNPSKSTLSTNSPPSTSIQGTSKPNTCATTTARPDEAGVPRTLHTSRISQSTHSVVKASPSTSKPQSETGKASQMSDLKTPTTKKGANLLYIELDNKIDGKTLTLIINRLKRDPIPARNCEEFQSFFDIGDKLESMDKIVPLKNDFNYLVQLFDELGLGELKQMVKDHMGERKKAGKPEELYNMDVALQPDRVNELVDVLKQYSLEKKGENRSTIPQRIFYTNTATGIARNDSKLVLRLGKGEVILTVPPKAVEKTEIISCYYAEESICCMLELDQERSHFLYSIPVTFGPSNLKFKGSVLLCTKHSAVIGAEATDTQPIKLCILDGDSKWREISEQDQICTMQEGMAIIKLDHFSTFVLAADRRLTSSLPLLKTRLITAFTKKTDQQGLCPQKVVICIVFDNDFTLKKCQCIVKEKYGAELDISDSDELLLKPFTEGEIELRSDMWVTKTHILKGEDVQNLISAPITYSTELVFEQQKLWNTCPAACQIVVTQEDMCQEFGVSKGDCSFVKKLDVQTHPDEFTSGELDIATMSFGAGEMQETHEAKSCVMQERKKRLSDVETLAEVTKLHDQVNSERDKYKQAFWGFCCYLSKYIRSQQNKDSGENRCQALVQASTTSPLLISTELDPHPLSCVDAPVQALQLQCRRLQVFHECHEDEHRHTIPHWRRSQQNKDNWDSTSGDNRCQASVQGRSISSSPLSMSTELDTPDLFSLHVSAPQTLLTFSRSLIFQDEHIYTVSQNEDNWDSTSGNNRCQAQQASSIPPLQTTAEVDSHSNLLEDMPMPCLSFLDKCESTSGTCKFLAPQVQDSTTPTLVFGTSNRHKKEHRPQENIEQIKAENSELQKEIEKMSKKYFEATELHDQHKTELEQLQGKYNAEVKHRRRLERQQNAPKKYTGFKAQAFSRTYESNNLYDSRDTEQI